MHIRAGNGEKGDFAHKGRTIGDRKAFVRDTVAILKQLATKGLVSYFPKGRRRVFQAEDPERLLSLGESKQQALSQAMEELR